MAKYYTKADYVAWQDQQVSYDAMYLAWKEHYDLIMSSWLEEQAVYKAAHDQWEMEYTQWEAEYGSITEGFVPPAPHEPADPTPKPELPPEPDKPVPNYTVWDSRITEQTEKIDTATGTAYVEPGRIVLTANGISFALSQEELDYSYVQAGV